jgi:signal transduction histidine kinase
MTENYKPHRPSAKRLFRQVGSRYALSNRTLLLFLIPAFGSGLVFDQLRLDGTFLIRLLVTTIGYLATVIPLLIARRALPNKPRPSRPVLILILFFMVGLIRGSVLLLLSIAIGEYQPGEELFRLAGAPIFTLVTLTVSAILAGNYSRHREVLNELSEERYRLQIRSAAVRAKVELQREELIAKVKNLIDPAISKIQQSLTKQASAEAVQSLRLTVDNVIRPLSTEVAEADDYIELESVQSATREKAPLPEKLILAEFLLPFWAALLTVISVISTALLVESLLNALALLFFSGIFVYGVLGLIQFLTAKFEVRTTSAIFLVPAIHGFAVLPFFPLVDLLNYNLSEGQLFAFVFFEVVLGGSLFYAQLVQLQRKQTTERLAQVNQELEILNATLRQELWLNRRRTASVLHGPIQAALYASAMKISQASAPSEALISEVEKDIQDALEKLSNPSNLELETIKDVLDQIVEIWSDSAKITIEIDSTLEGKISRQPLATEATLEVVREFITNAMKHGSATKVKAKIGAIDDSRFFIQVKDNGTGLVHPASNGFGTKLLSELSLTWSRKREKDTTVCYAEIVLGRDNL